MLLAIGGRSAPFEPMRHVRGPYDRRSQSDSLLSFALLDATGDGRLDLVGADTDGSQLGIVPGRGDGTFDRARAVRIPTGRGLDGFAAGDVTGDGLADVVAGQEAGRYRLLVFPGRAGAGLGAPVNVSTGLRAFSMQGLSDDLHEIVLADLGPPGGPLDLVVLGDRGSVTVMRNRAGRLGLPRRIAFPMAVYGVAGIDVTGDGRGDLLVTGERGVGWHEREWVQMLASGPRGSWRRLPPVQVADWATPVPGILEGKPVALVAEPDRGRVGIVTVRAGRLAVRRSFAGGDHPALAVVGDANGDGREDLLVQDSGHYLCCDEFAGGGVSFLEGKVGGGFADPVPADVGDVETGNQSPDGMAVADLNGDGRSDVVLGNFPQGGVDVLLARRR